LVIIILKIQAVELMKIINNDFRDSLFNRAHSESLCVCMTYALYVYIVTARFYRIAANHTKSPGHFGIRVPY